MSPYQIFTIQVWEWDLPADYDKGSREFQNLNRPYVMQANDETHAIATLMERAGYGIVRYEVLG